MSDAKLSGPYVFYIATKDALYSSYNHYESVDYQYSQFRSPDAYSLDEIDDFFASSLPAPRNTSNSNSMRSVAFDDLIIALPLVASLPDNYVVLATLLSEEGAYITSYTADVDLSDVPVNVNIIFSGEEIYHYGYSGQFIVLINIFNQDRLRVSSEKYVTDEYQHTDFVH